jgi:hypothetical protein
MKKITTDRETKYSRSSIIRNPVIRNSALSATKVFFNFTVLSGIVGSWPPLYPESSNEIEI